MYIHVQVAGGIHHSIVADGDGAGRCGHKTYRERAAVATSEELWCPLQHRGGPKAVLGGGTARPDVHAPLVHSQKETKTDRPLVSYWGDRVEKTACWMA